MLMHDAKTRKKEIVPRPPRGADRKSRVETRRGVMEGVTRVGIWATSWRLFFETLGSLAKDPAELFERVAQERHPPQPHFSEQLAYVSLALGTVYQPVAHVLGLPHFSLLNWIGDLASTALFLFVVGLVLLVAPLVLTNVRAGFFYLTSRLVGGRGTFRVTRNAADLADAPLILVGLFLSAGRPWWWLSLISILADYLLALFAMTRVHRRPWSAILLGQAAGIAGLGVLGGLIFLLGKG